MAGIYIHIPFCVTRCTYCDFFSNTDMRFKTTYPEAIIRELELRKDYLRGEPVDTIYFGGGTPSQLAPAEIRRAACRARVSARGQRSVVARASEQHARCSH